MRLNPRLHSLERRLQTEEDRSAQRMSEIERVSMIQSAKLGIAQVLMRADCARGEGEDIGAVEDLLAAMPEELEAVLRKQLAELPPGALRRLKGLGAGSANKSLRCWSSAECLTSRGSATNVEL